MKYYRTIIWLGVLAVLSAVPILFSLIDAKADLYLFADHERYIENICYDVYGMLSTTILTWRVWVLIPDRRYKRYAFDYLVVSLLAFPGYFLFYSQYVNLFFVPILAILIYRSYLKNT